ncbi:hypothetical protein RJG79_05980 [Mycoplasmatota bacterium WC44]
MMNKLLKLRATEIRKSINSPILSKNKLIIGLKASIIAIVFTLAIHAILINMAIILFMYKTILLLFNLFFLILAIIMTIAFAEDIYYDLLNREGYIDKSVNLKKLRINGLFHNSIIGVIFSLITSIITYLIIIII